MAKAQSHPFRGFLDMMSEMERIRNLGRSGPESGQETEPRTHATAWVPTTDILARGKDLVIVSELPGIPPSDIDISVSDGVLTISGERPSDPKDSADTSYVRERCHGPFRRSMILPEGVEEQTITAAFDNGVVTITVPNAIDAPVPVPHRVPISHR